MIYDGVITKPPIEQLLIHSGIKGIELTNRNYICNEEKPSKLVDKKSESNFDYEVKEGNN